MWIIVTAVITFALCFLLDRAYQKLFRGKAQHKSGRAVRQSRRYGSVGLVIGVIGLAALIAGSWETALVPVAGVVLLLFGAGLVVYYMSFGIYYDSDTFLVESFGRKPRTYYYHQITHQQLFVLQGGGIVVELYLTDGDTVQIISNMPSYDQFLEHAFRQWCRQKDISPDACDFYDPAKSLWFPAKEET